MKIINEIQLFLDDKVGLCLLCDGVGWCYGHEFPNADWIDIEARDQRYTCPSCYGTKIRIKKGFSFR